MLEQEEEPGLGNGGLGRLAACFLDSLATLQIPAIGYGIRYEFGIFDQAHPRRLAGRDHRQMAALRQSVGDSAARNHFPVGFGGQHRALRGRAGQLPRALGSRTASWAALPTTRRILGYGGQTPSTCCGCGRPGRRESFDFQAFNVGDYYRAPSQDKSRSENITKVLYPNDEPAEGKRAPPRAAVLLRLVLAAGHDPHLPAARQDAAISLPREVRHPAQRHPSRRSPSPS